LVGPIGGTLWWDPFVGPICGTHWWDPLVGPIGESKSYSSFVHILFCRGSILFLLALENFRNNAKSTLCRSESLFREYEFTNRKVGSAFQCWQSSMVAKWGTSLSTYFFQGFCRTDEALKERPWNIERRFPLYDVSCLKRDSCDLLDIVIKVAYC
jgi:hypothetical protein